MKIPLCQPARDIERKGLCVRRTSLPPGPNLELYTKLAEEFQQACNSSDPDAIRNWAGGWTETLARLQGQEITPEVQRKIHRNKERVERQWHNFRKSNEDAAHCALADAQLFLARCHGFANWPKFVGHLEELTNANSPVSKFELAADAIIDGNIATLSKLLRENPQLAQARSTREHGSTLLHYISANGIEDFRQKTPGNVVEIAKLLLDAGAEVNAESDAYGGGCTALGLVATSVHPERADMQEALMQILLDHGAAIDQTGVAGNRHTAVEGCLANGRGKAAQFLALRGARLNLETAAGAGRLDIVQSFFNEDGSLKSSATKEQVQRGFLWACMYGREEVVEFLLDHGTDLRDQADTGGTGLHWAAGGGHLSIVHSLIELGAPLEETNQWGGTVLEHVGWAFANGDPDRDYSPIFEELLAAGAKVQDGWLEWLERQSGRPAETRDRVAELLGRYGSVT